MTTDTPAVIYFVATKPDTEKALGDRMYHYQHEAQATAYRWREITGAPYRVFRATVTVEETTHDA